ncbi:MAG: hypothetical protein ACK5IB_10055 [Qingshengfaniella sp.]
MSAHLAVDLGARFADFVFWDASGLRVAKVPNQPDMAAALAEGIARLAADLRAGRS